MCAIANVWAESVDDLRAKAEQGDVNAQFTLAESYAKGQGVDKNNGEALKWLQKAAQQGHAEAQAQYGRCFHTGEGVEKDIGKAVEWYGKSAKQGNASAQNNLGVCYRDGTGVCACARAFVAAADQLWNWRRVHALSGAASVPSMELNK